MVPGRDGWKCNKTATLHAEMVNGVKQHDLFFLLAIRKIYFTHHMKLYLMFRRRSDAKEATIFEAFCKANRCASQTQIHTTQWFVRPV